MSLDKADGIAALLLSVFVAIVYLATLGPTVTGEDSGELIAAAHTMGIPHPPGYPTWTLLGKLFSLIPLGTVAWRVNLMSAVFASLAVGLLFLLGRKLSQPRWAAASGAGAFGFSRELWEQAVIAEVYTLNAFFFAACLLLLIRWYECRDRGSLLALAALYGLSLGNHNTMAFLGPIFAGFILLTDCMPWRRWPLYVWAAALVTGFAMAVHLYLPLRSAANPPVDWGNPENWDNFWSVVTRAQYAFMFTEDPRSLAQFGRQCWSLAGTYLNQFSPWLGLLALPGVLVLARREPVRGGLLLLVMAWLTLGYLLILNTRLERETIWVASVFYIPSWLLLALGLSESLHEGLRRIVKPGRPALLRGGLAAALLLTSIVSPLLWNFDHNDRSAYRFTHDFARNILDTMEHDAIYFPSADHATFPVLYLQAVEGLRPDVTIANKYGYPEQELYKRMPGRERFSLIPSSEEERLIQDWIIQNNDRPVYFSARRDMQGLPGHTLRECGLLFRVLRPGESPPEHDYWASYTWNTLDENATAGELTADYVLSDVFYMQGRAKLAQGDLPSALALFDRVAAINPDNKETLNNLGSACAELGHLEAALKYLELALVADPSYSTALLNLAKVQVERGEHADAILKLESLLRVDGMNVEAIRLSAQSLRAIHWFGEAIKRYEFLIRLLPNDAELFRELGDLHISHNDDRASASRMYLRSLQLDPNQPELSAKLAQLETLPDTAAPELPEVPDPFALLPQLPGSPHLQAPITQDIPMPSFP